jgi:hypothetical protein
MLKKLMISSAVTALLLSPAVAQTSAPPAPPTAPQQSASGSAAPEVIKSQGTNQLLASKFKGTAVMGADDQKIGGVTDVLFDQSGKVEAYVIGVGGFLGIGQKDVALAPSAFQMIKDRDTDSMKLKTSMTRDQLDKAASFEPHVATPSTTGSGGSRPPAGGLGSSRSPTSPPAR